MDRKSFPKWSLVLALLACLGVVPGAQAACSYYIQMYSPAAGANYTAPANIQFQADAAGSDDGCNVFQVKFYNGTTLLAQVGPNSNGMFGYTWSGVPAGSYTVKAVTGNGAATAIANITVSPPQNQTPTVSMGTPTGAPFVAPASIGLSASASDADGSISKVEFYQGASLIATDAAPPYTAAYTASAAGTYSFTAKATDNTGASTTSAPVSATVAANSLPSVSLTSPTNGSTYITPTTIPISASATDSDGSIVRVEFRANGTLLASDVSAPYEATWTSGNTGGTFPITATAVDNKGGTRVATINVTLNTPLGSLTANPNPCTILSSDYCQTTVSWTSNDPAAQIWRHYDHYVQTQEGPDDRHVAIQVGLGTSGSGSFDIGGTKRNQYFVLQSGGAVITSLAPSSNFAPWSTITAPTAGQVFNRPTNIVISATGTDSDDTVNRVEFFVDGTLLATDSTSPYSVTWTDVASGSYALTTRVYDSRGASRQSAPVSIIANTPPTIALTAPVTGTVTAAPANVLIRATAADADDGVSMVEFYNGATKLATDTVAPYELQWNGVAAGTYGLTAKAYDNRGGAAVSSVSNLIVDSLPTVSVTAPTTGTVINAPGSYTLTASASDSDGTINRVEFYQGSTLIGTDNVAPYSVLWSNIGAGTYAITATAFDDRGLSKTSTATSFVVNAIPSVSITAPVMNAVVVAPADVLIQANATDPDDGIAMVEFYVDGQIRATDIMAPFTLEARNMPAGVYSLTARAYDNRGGATMSAATTLIVNERPQIQLLSPTNGAGVVLPAQVTLLANASDSDGAIIKVEFYNGTSVIGSTTTAPYQLSWAVPAAGDYTITAKAFDNRGTGVTSAVAVLYVRDHSWELPYDTSTSPPDTASDQVAATAAEFRVNETGAATYSIPLFTVPGTAGVAPKLSLNYSSVLGAASIGKGWAIGGISSISRCRASREAGDFIVGGVATDGNPLPVTFSASDRYCLDGQRLIAAPSGSAACPAVSGMTATNLRTEIESFQRVCAYASDGNGPKFFTVERQDGSISWYGDRDNNLTSNRSDGYLNSTAPGKTDMALSWAQTRFQDSTGNYIDYIYTEDVSAPGEQLISKVRYTGKTVLQGQSGSALLPFAEVVFNYQYMPYSVAYILGGANVLNHRLDSITSRVDSDYDGTFKDVRHYALTYNYGSSNPILTALQECSDSTKQVCAAPTTFQWSQGTSMLGGPNGFFETGEISAHLYQGSLSKFMGLKFGDIDGDGRQDLVWLKETRSGDACSTEFVNVAYSRLDAAGQIALTVGDYVMCSPGQLAWSTHSGDGSWFLYDYDGDGRDDWFSAGPVGAWVGYRSTGDATHPFDTSVNLLSELSQPIPNGGELENEPQHADLNGDGLIDLVYPREGLMYARIMERGGSYGFKWGAERQLIPTDAAGTQMITYGFYHKNNYQQLNDFNADARSDLLINAAVGCGGGGGGSGGGSSGGGGGWQQENVQANRAISSTSTMTTASTSTAQGCIVPFSVDQITATTVTVKRYGTGSFGSASSSEVKSFADINGDGLTDEIFHGTNGSVAGWHLNTGVDWSATSVGSGNLGIASGGPNTQVADINGDGRADILTPLVDGTRFRAWYGTVNGGFAGPVTLANLTTDCGDLMCVPTRSYMFQDMDGDGNVEYVRIKWDEDGSSPVYFSRPSAANRYAPRDAIVKITNGLGAETDISYDPLTNNALYRPFVNTRNTQVWGRGTAVQDLLAPMYVVSSVSSTSPQAGNPNAKATVRYRYFGARMQAGGRGFLGFASIDTIDANHATGYVSTTTTYSQNFPFVGLPMRTIKRAAIGQVYAIPACLAGPVTDSCFSAPGFALPSLPGAVFSDNTQLFEADTEFAGTAITPYAPGVQLPVQVRTAGTDEKLIDPYNGVQTSRVVTALDYAAYGNVSATTVDTYTGTAATPMATMITANVYGSDNPTLWRLGRLTQSTVTHRRPGRSDVVRTASFDYNMAGPATGLLSVERTQAGKGAAQDLRKEYGLDEFGNRTLVETCADPATACDPGMTFHPASPTSIQRYSRVVYDSRGRFPKATYEPFWTQSGGAELRTQQVLARNDFGDVTDAIDINGVRSIAVASAFGRPYYTWVQTVAGATGPSGGRESWSTFRWCGTGTGQVDCPAGAKFRKKTQAEGAATEWTYLDTLGRTVMTASLSFNVGVNDKDVVAVCTDYDIAGKPRRVSNPFFLPGTAGAEGPTGLASVCASASRLWTTTVYDVLGRVTDVTSPDANEPGSLALTSTDYSGTTTIVTDPRGKRTTQVRNGKGEITSVIDATGFAMTYAYYADGTLYYVHRDAGRGQIRNTFAYDELGRKITQNDPDAGDSSYEYNALGELVAQQDANGNRIENEIDARGRVWRKTVRKAGGTVESQSTFTFDTAPNGAGQLAAEVITGIYNDWAALGASQPQLNLAFSRSHSYDVLGRWVGSTTTIDNVSYPAVAQYDTLGRAWKSEDASSRWIKNEFNARGFVTRICNSSATDMGSICPSDANTYLQTLETDTWGHVIKERRGNSAAMDVARTYKADTGRIWSICAGDIACNLVNEGYGWDANGNLHTHQKESRYLEQFTYDDLNRLTEGRLVMEDGATVDRVSQAFVYDSLGNICRKSEWGNDYDYVYGGRTGCGLGALPGDGADVYTGPTRLVQIGVTHFAYDDRGNQTSKFRLDTPGTSKDRFVRYSLDDKGYEIALGNLASPVQRTRFWYGPDGQRYKREDGNRLTRYVGNVEVITENGVTTYKRYIAGVMVQEVVGSTAINRYMFHDQLGSIVKITDANGTAIQTRDFDAFGERRDPSNATALGATPSPNITTRGFTGHEHTDGVYPTYVVHMNGRLYSSSEGRFLQPDPFIQAPYNAQSWNAYSYVFNNPLRYTDPTGMLGVEERQWLAAVVMIVSIFFAPEYTPEAAGAFVGYFAVAGFVSGAIATQSWKGGLMGAMTGAVTAGIGGLAGQGAFTFTDWTVLTFTGGVMGSLQGGEFGNSFLSAGLSAAFMPQLGRIGNDVGRTLAGAIVGGTISELTGGKFANGAVSGAVQATLAQGEVLETGSENGTTIAPATPNPEAENFLLSEAAHAGELYPAAFGSEIDAHAAAANRYTGASIAARRETNWRVYELGPDSFGFSYPSVTEVNGRQGSMPGYQPKGIYRTAGHAHWDGNVDFSGKDWLWVTGNKRTLYLSAGDGRLQYSTFKQAKPWGTGSHLHQSPPATYPGLTVPDVTIKSTYP